MLYLFWQHLFIVPGVSCHTNQLWDWDSWLTDIGINQIRRDNGNMYVMLKEVLRRMSCFDCGSVRAPLTGLIEREKRCNNNTQIEKNYGIYFVHESQRKIHSY